MDLSELRTIIARGEGPHVEFKEDFPRQADDVAREMASLANAGGGILLMGVRDDQTLPGIKGQASAEIVIQRLAGFAGSEKMSPPLLPNIERVSIGKDVFVVYAKVPDCGPVLYDGKYYTRYGSTRRTVTRGDELRALFSSGNLGTSSNPTSLASPFFTPPPLRGFEGRAKELKRLNDLFASKSITVIIIEGIGGIGKTTFLARFAVDIRSQGYVCLWIDCHEDTVFDSVVSAAATAARTKGEEFLGEVLEDVALNVSERINRIAVAIAEQKYALFFNDYHYIKDPLVNRLVHRISERAIYPKIIMTSRTRPKIASSISPILLAEEPLRTGLDLRASTQVLAGCGLKLSKATARRIWILTGEGHPKALEIFAARTRTHSVSELLRSLPIFREEMTNEWLSPLLGELSEDERTLAIDLSVFDRPITFRSLISEYPERDVHPLMISLVDRFIIDARGDDVIEMHMLLREFCYGLIPDKVTKHKWAAEYYKKQIQAIRSDEVATDLEIEVRIAAWSHLIKAEEAEKAESELHQLRRLLMTRGNYDQAMQLIEQTPLSEKNRERYEIDKARILSLRGDFDRAVSIVKPLVNSSEFMVAREAILVLATIYQDHNQGVLSKQLLEKQLNNFLADDAGTRLRRRFLARLVEAYLMTGEAEKASEWARKFIEACEADGDEISGAIAIRQMANVLREQKLFSEAISLYHTSRDLFRKRGRMRDIAMTEQLLSKAYNEFGDLESGRRYLQSAFEAFKRMGDRRNISITRQQLGEL
jgi:tetratricopeptide (TPR) repeat protein